MKNDAQYKVIAELIHGFLEEKEIVAYGELPIVDEIIDKLQVNSFYEKGITSQQLNCERDTEYAVFVPYDPKKTAEDFLFGILGEPLEEGEPMTVHIVMIARTVADLLELKEKGKKTKIVTVAKAWAAKRKDRKGKSKINYYTAHCPEKKDNSFSIHINSRIRALHYKAKSKDSATIESNVYIVKLFDLVEMYNKIGNELFARNVRYHIKDVLNVESEIHRTLENHPEEFFSLNNGIAIQVADAKNIDRRNEGDIRLAYEKKADFSVINGAQTISAAAEYFYRKITEDPDGKKQKALDSAKEEAYVLLRVFYPPEGSTENCESAFGNITVSLNRQKPINPVDVGYICEEVSRINALCDQEPGNAFYFKLLKRGQVGFGRFGYQLSEFGRLVTAYYHEEPGKARAKPTTEIVQNVKDIEDVSWKNKTIYADFQMDDSDSEIFMQWYKPVNFANALSKVYIAADKENRNKAEVSADVRSVLSYGRYFFVAYVINILCPQKRKGNGKVDFSDFLYEPDALDEKDKVLKNHILKFAELVAKNARVFMQDSSNHQTILGSNDFKKEEIYTKWCEYAKENTDVMQWQKKLKQILNGENPDIADT